MGPRWTGGRRWRSRAAVASRTRRRPPLAAPAMSDSDGDDENTFGDMFPVRPLWHAGPRKNSGRGLIWTGRCTWPGASQACDASSDVLLVQAAV